MIAQTAIAPATRRAPAAPAGGPFWGRGCALVAVLAGSVVTAQPVDVPSGQDMTLNEVLVDDMAGETWVRFRFVAPKIGDLTGQIGHDVSANDMDHLCDKVALPYLAQEGLAAQRVVISLANADIAFGVSDPAITQFFEAYRPEADGCIWEGL